MVHKKSVTEACKMGKNFVNLSSDATIESRSWQKGSKGYFLMIFLKLHLIYWFMQVEKVATSRWWMWI